MKIPFKNYKSYYEEYFIDDKKRPLIVIIPGGGYAHTSIRESLPIKDIYNKNGYHCIVIHYTEDHLYYPFPSKMCAEVIKKYENDPRVSHLIGIGFSAGGHNLLEIALHKENYAVNFDLIMLSYPVITTDNKYWHKGSFEYLLGDKIDDQAMLKRLSMENEVKKDAPDLFLWGTFTDESVDVMNSIKLVEAYKKNGLSVEYHLYPMGGHGLSLATEESSGGDNKKVIPYVSTWINESLKWLEYKLKEL